MLIERFRAKAIHGYLNFDLKFDRDVTFLTGINGCGKTSVIYSIISLISPSLYILAKLQFRSIEVWVKHDDSAFTIQANRIDDQTTLTTSTTTDKLVIPTFTPDPDDIHIRQMEQETAFYHELITKLGDHEVLRLINSLPNPMFLDLDRRPSVAEPPRRQSSRYMYRARNIFSPNLTRGLLSAAALADERYRELVLEERALSERLRRQMVLSLLTMEPIQRYGEITKPEATDIDAIDNMRQTASTLPHLLDVPKEDVESRIFPLLDRLSGYANNIPRNKSVEDLMGASNLPENLETLKALFGWSANRPQLMKVTEILKYVSAYTKERNKLNAEMNSYLQNVSKFLVDSGKELLFNRAGELVVLVKALEDTRPVTSLSSGEAQIFVILTHLFFNPLARQANVFIIDEPELSLHVQWQELFVDSLRTANSSTQMIMATHSPAIILERLEKCRDLSPTVTTRRKRRNTKLHA